MRRGDEAKAAPGQRIFFTGPDGVGDYRPRSNYFPRYVGTGPTSPEATGDLAYLFRAAPGAPAPLPKNSYMGGIGWGWRYNQLLNSGALHSDMQIKKIDVGEALEESVNQVFHNTQNAAPQVADQQEAPTRGGPAWTRAPRTR